MPTRTRKTGTEEKILATAADLFYAHGLRGVGIDRSTLYAHFRTKDELVAAYLRRTDDSWTGQLRTAAARAGEAPGEQLIGVFDALLDAFDRHGFFGCPFVSAAVEAELDSTAREITVQHVRRRQDWLTGLCRQAGALDPGALARQIGLLIDGALAAGRLLQDRGVVDDAKSAARLLVAVHTHPPPPPPPPPTPSPA